MAVMGKIAEFTYGDKNEVYSTNHPRIILDVRFPESLGQVERGTVIGLDSSGNFVVYDPNAKDSNGNPEHKQYGVLVEDFDAAKSTSAKVLVLGVVYKDAVKVKGNALAFEDIEALRGINIYIVNRV